MAPMSNPPAPTPSAETAEPQTAETGGSEPIDGEPGSGVRQILLIAGLAAGLVLILLTLFALRDRSVEHERAEELAANTSTLLAEHAGRLIEASEFLLDQAADLVGPPGTAVPNNRETHLELRRMTDAVEFVESTYLTDDEGWNRVTSREWPVRSLNLSDRAYFQALRDGAVGPIAERLETNPFTGRALIVVGKRLPSADGSFRGIAGMAVSVDYFRQFYERIDVGYALSVSLLRSDGTVLIRHPQLRDGEPRAVGGLAERLGDRSAATLWATSEIDGTKRLFSVRRLPGRDLWVSVGLDAAAIRDRWMDQVRTYAIYALVALGAIGGLAFLALVRARREAMAWDRLREANRTLEQRVADRTAALTLANAELGAALKDKEVLFREVHHRVKNNLQVICSLLRLQADRLPREQRQGFEESLSRVQAMSLVHEMLYRSNQPSRIDFADYSRQLVDTLADAFADEMSRVRFTVRAEPLVLDLDTAIPLGLLVSELVGNAVKHAFPDGRTGTVTLDLEHSADKATLRVSDDGIGLPPARRSGGLGLMLVESLASQVDGALSLGHGPQGGTVAELRFPWPGGRDVDQAA